MTSQLWKFYLEDDVESFLRVLEEASRSGRQHSQKGYGGGQVIGQGSSIGSPPGHFSSPLSSSKQQRHDTIGTISASPLTRDDVNKRDGKGLSLLHHVASSPRKSALAFAQALLAHPLVDLYIQDWESGWTALHRAFYFGNISIAHAIIDRDMQNVLNQTSTSTTQLPSLKKIKDREGHGPYDILTSTIKDRTLAHDANDYRLPLSGLVDDYEEDAQGDDDVDGDYRTRHGISSFFNIQGDEALNFGTNKNSSLGFSDGDDRQHPEHITLKRPKHLFKRFYVEHLKEKLTACAGHPALEENVQGQLQLARSGSRPPFSIMSKPIVIVDVQMAKFHTAVITDDPESNLYICGHGHGGRLGAGDEKTLFTFTCLQDASILHKKVIAVALGQDHTCAVTSDGSIFTWGSNKYGQLGTGMRRSSQGSQDECNVVPKQLYGILKREIVVGVAASRTHSVAHTTSSLFTWGKNEGQLGAVTSRAAELEIIDTPRKVAASRFSSPIRSVSAIERATCVLLENREVHVLANYGVVRVNFPVDGFANPLLTASSMATRHDDTKNQISKITCGGDTICALSTAGEIFTVIVEQCAEPSTSKSTTNPNKIRAALSVPEIVWGLRKGYMSARDVSLDLDGSIVLTTEAGSVWRRVLRTRPSVSLTQQPSSKKEYKYSRVPGLSRVIAVRASGSGSYSAIRRDCDVTKTQIFVQDPTLWSSTFDLLPIDITPISSAFDYGSTISEAGGQKVEFANLDKLIVGLKQSQDPEKLMSQILRPPPVEGSDACDVKVTSSVSEISIPAHAFILAGRSRILRDAFATARKHGSWDSEVLSISWGADKILTCKFHALDILSLWEIVLWSYTDRFVGFWLLAHKASASAFRYRQIRTEVMKAAAFLDMRNLEASMRRMVPFAEYSLDKDMSIAIDDPAFFNDADAIVELSDGELYIHSSIFSKRSPFFEGLFVGKSRGGWLADRREHLHDEFDVVPVDMKHIELRVFRLVLRHVYTDVAEELFDDIAAEDTDEFLDLVLEVLSAANELMMDRLSQICQNVVGRFVNARNVCQLLNAVSPCSMTQFKDAALEYLCLNLETLLFTRLIDELDEDLLEDLDDVVKANQLAAMPFAKSGAAELALFERHPELAERIDRDRQTKIDAFSVRIKYGASLDLDDDDFLKSPTFRRQPASMPKSPVPGMTLSSKGKQPAGEPPTATKNVSVDGDEMNSRVQSTRVASAESRPQPFLSSPRSPQITSMESGRSVELGSSVSLSQKSSRSPILAATREPPSPLIRPWGETTMPTAKLGIKEIMDQASISRTSGLSLGLAAQDPITSRTGAGYTSRMSQKERKKMQQEQSRLPETPTSVLTQPKREGSSPSPWKTVSSSPKPPSTLQPAQRPTISASPEQSRSSSTPHLTMRQTIANAPSSKKEDTLREPPRTPKPQAQRSAAASQVSSPQQPSNPTTPSSAPKTPSVQSIRHQPPPSARPNSATGPGSSIADILAQQQAEKNEVREAVAPRSLQDVMIEQEFQQWWDQESKKVMEQESARDTGSQSRGRNQRGRNRRGRGKERAGRQQ